MAPVGRLIAALVLAASTASAQTGKPSGDASREVPPATAKALVDRLLAAVDRDGLLPTDRTDYDASREALRRYVDAAAGSPVPRSVLYTLARRHLRTLDADGHTLLWSRVQTQGWTQRTAPEEAGRASTVERLETPDGVVLVFHPPAATFTDPKQATAYAREVAEQVARAEVAPRPCALVVSLDDQTGGNAWPVIEAMHNVFTPRNQARFVYGRGQRVPIVQSWSYARNETFARFAGTPVGVVMSERTASAGEMLAVMLQGEPGVRTFGQPSYGMTTANQSMPMPDDALLLLSVARYAVGQGAPGRGPLQPDVAVPVSERQSRAVREAAEWAASQAPACKAAHLSL